MKLERRGCGENQQTLLNGKAVSPETLNEVCTRYFTLENWREVQRELQLHGKVYAVLVFVNNDLRLQDKLDDANKKIAALEKKVAELAIEDAYRTA